MGALATFGLVQPASADTKNVTITVNDWNCMLDGRYQGTITGALIEVVPGNNPPAKWEGRSRNVNVIYQPSGSRVAIAIQIFCKTTWYGAGYYRTISTGRWVDRNTSSDWQV
ncbi:hypothetical protein [Kribbella monticola]|uniref:hypothetical protein n=1 Tax=Kribbella monticola TaxID=2185285 RepID=UPI000DD4C3EE|nr:hypothetical protein [Kribbella monticola]